MATEKRWHSNPPDSLTQTTSPPGFRAWQQSRAVSLRLRLLERVGGREQQGASTPYALITASHLIQTAS